LTDLSPTRCDVPERRAQITAVTTVRLSEGLDDEFRELARRLNRSKHALILMAIEAGIQSVRDEADTIATARALKAKGTPRRPPKK
jgi:predicted transcriptional regulator